MYILLSIFTTTRSMRTKKGPLFYLPFFITHFPKSWNRGVSLSSGKFPSVFLFPPVIQADTDLVVNFISCSILTGCLDVVPFWRPVLPAITNLFSSHECLPIHIQWFKCGNPGHVPSPHRLLPDAQPSHKPYPSSFIL